MKHIARSTIIIAVFFGLEKVLGFVRQVMVSRTFGLSLELDAFNAANNIPDMIFALISGGAMAMALIPVLSEYLETRGRRQAWDVFSRIVNLVFLVTAVLSILIAIFAKEIIGWNIGIAPGFSPEQQSLVADLMRLNLLATLFFSMAGLVIAGLQANQHFILPAIAPSMYDLGALIGILILVPDQGVQLGPITLPALGLGVRGLVYGTILGAGLFFIIQVPGLIKYKFHWSPKIDLVNPGVRKVLTVFGPRILTMFFIQSIFIATDNIASRLVEGSITALVYGWLFMQVPETLIGTAIGTAILPTLSEQVVRGEQEALKQSLNTAVRVILALTIPAATLLIAGIRPLAEILGFDQAGTDLVVWITRAYSLGLVAYALIEVTARTFYAQQNAGTPLLTIFITAILFVLMAIPFAQWLGAPGIALANAIAFTIQLLVMGWLINRQFPGFAQAGSTLRRILPASLGAGILVVLFYRILPLDTAGTLFRTIMAAGALTIAGAFTLPFLWPEIKNLGKL